MGQLKATQPKESLTPLQLFTLGVITEYWEIEGRSPCYAEIQNELEIKSKSGVAKLVYALTRKGYLKKRRRGVQYGLVPLIKWTPPECVLAITVDGRAALETSLSCTPKSGGVTNG